MKADGTERGKDVQCGGHCSERKQSISRGGQGFPDLSPVPAPSQGRSKTPNIPDPRAMVRRPPHPTTPSTCSPACSRCPRHPTPSSAPSLCIPFTPLEQKEQTRTPGVRHLASLPHPLITSMHWPQAWCRSPVTDFCGCSEGWKLRSHFTDEETKAQWGARARPNSAFWSLSPLSPKQRCLHCTEKIVGGHTN